LKEGLLKTIDVEDRNQISHFLTLPPVKKIKGRVGKVLSRMIELHNPTAEPVVHI